MLRPLTLPARIVFEQFLWFEVFSPHHSKSTFLFSVEYRNYYTHDLFFFLITWSYCVSWIGLDFLSYLQNF